MAAVVGQPGRRALLIPHTQHHCARAHAKLDEVESVDSVAEFVEGPGAQQ